MPTVEPLRTVRAELAFSRPEDVSPDDARPGLLRVPDVDVEQASNRQANVCPITAEDCAALPSFSPDLVEHGFARVDLSREQALQELLGRIRTAGRLEAAQASEIRRALVGRSLPLSGGRRVKLLFVARDGLLMRKAGPNGMKMHPEGAALGMNTFDGAQGVHADQDVRGTPLRQLMRGAAPWLFHHEQPDSRNAHSRLFLLNIWIPLEQVTRPLALMDRRSLDRQRHQLRMGLRVDSFLERGMDSAVNDIWSFLHDDGQRWYFTSELEATSAYVFETLSTPHGSFILPGEACAEARHRQLEQVTAALDACDAAAVSGAVSAPRCEPDDDVTAPLRAAIAQMDALLDEAAERGVALCQGEGAADWRERARRAQQRVVRKSIELRAIGIVTRDAWPFNRW